MVIYMKKIIYSLVILLGMLCININAKADNSCTNNALKPCFSGTCESSNESILKEDGPTTLHGNYYTQFTCMGSGDVTVTCQRVGYTIIYRHHVTCSGAADPVSNGSTENEGTDVGGSSNTGTTDTEGWTDTDGGSSHTGGFISKMCDVNENPGVMRAFKAGGYALYILKIVIPIILIIMGVVDLFQAVIGNDDKDVTKSVTKLIYRVIAGVVIFIIPTVINYVFNLVDNNPTSNFKECYECLLDASKCPVIPKVGG